MESSEYEVTISVRVFAEPNDPDHAVEIVKSAIPEFTLWDVEEINPKPRPDADEEHGNFEEFKCERYRPPIGVSDETRP